MTDPLSIYMAYGPGMSFSLELGENADYAFTLEGNVEPLFPKREIGHWAGTDPSEQPKLRAVISSAMAAAASNPPSMPDSAFVAVSREQQGAKTSREYSLYEPPPAWVPAQDQVLQAVHGAWANSRVRTLAAEASLLASPCSLQRGMRPTASIKLESKGREAVCFASPLDANAWEIIVQRLAPPAATPGEAAWSRLAVHEFAVSEPVAPGGPRLTGSTAELAPAAELKLNVEILSPLLQGRYEIHIKLLCLRPAALSEQQAAHWVDGVFTFEPLCVEVIP